MGKAGGCAASQSEAIGRLASLALRSGVQPGMIVKQLKGISCHLPSWGGNGGKILSCADAVSKAIEWYLEKLRGDVPRLPEARRRGLPPHGEESILSRRRGGDRPRCLPRLRQARSSGRRGASSAAPAASPSADERHLRHL